MSGCLTCGDELGQPGRFRYRLGPTDSFDWLGELCVDCGETLLQRAGEERCLVCDDPVAYTVRRLAHTETDAHTRTYSPDVERAAFCEAHRDDWSPESCDPGAAGAPGETDTADAAEPDDPNATPTLSERVEG